MLETRYIKKFDKKRKEIMEKIDQIIYCRYEDLFNILFDSLGIKGKTVITGFDDYQGTITATRGKFSSSVWYGSCSWCDALEYAFQDSKEQSKDLFKIVLNMFQNMIKE